MRIAVETLGAVKARQMIWTTADAEATRGLSDSDLVRTYTQVTPFGSYLRAIEPALGEPVLADPGAAEAAQN
jgi:hypothetical protein